MKAFIGIDVSKDSLDVCILTDNETFKPKYRKVRNTPEGFDELVNWAEKHTPKSDRHYCLEATGCYGEQIAIHLAATDRKVSVENPRPIKQFRGAAALKIKTDKTDAYCIALYTQKMEPREWHLNDPILREIVQLQTRKRQITKMRVAEKNRLENKHLPILQHEQILEHLAFLNRQTKQVEKRIKELIVSSPRAQTIIQAVTGMAGIGPECGLIIATMAIEDFPTGQIAATSFGLNPRVNQSGIWMGQTRISKAGDSASRATFVSAATSAIHNDDNIKAFYDQLISNGLKPQQAKVAVARKLVVRAWAVARRALLGLPVYYPGGEKRGRNMRVYI